MQIWVLFGAVSVALNLLMALLWIFHSKKKKSKLEELTNALDSMRSNFHAFFNSPTIGIFTGKIGQVAATLNSNLLTMLGIEGTSEFHPFGFLVSQIQEKQLLETGRCGPIEVEVTGKGGHKINLSVTIVSNSGMDGNCIGIVIDVTKLFDVKRQLSKSLERFRALADGSPVGIWNVKRDGQTVYINPAMTALLELESPFELMNSDTRWHDFLPERV